MSEEDNQESIQTEDLDPEGARISNQAPEGETSTMVVVKWSDAIKWQRVKVDGPQCGGLYKEDNGYIITWPGTDPDSKMNSFTLSTEENYLIVLGGHYNEEFNNWKEPNNTG